MVVMDVTNNLNNLKFDEFDNKLKEFALQHHVPIIVDEGLALLEMLIRIHKPKKILEIGTAIGYSAIRMHKVSKSHITTIEKNISMYEEALKNVKEAGLDEFINIINNDALEAFDSLLNERYDMIFIDAAKAQYLKFFNLYSPLLNDGGIIICDNMLFHGLINDHDNYDKQTRSVRGIIRKLSDFHKALLEKTDFETSIFDIGDGLSVSFKK